MPGGRWVVVAPPDGTAKLALVTPEPDSQDFRLIGQARQIVFLTQDVPAKYQQWLERGVAFHHPPKVPAWAECSQFSKTPMGTPSR